MSEKTCPASYPFSTIDAPCELPCHHEGKHEGVSVETCFPIRWDYLSAWEYNVDGTMGRVLPVAHVVRKEQSEARHKPVKEAKKNLLDAKRAYHDALFADDTIDKAYDEMNEALDRYDQAQDLASSGMPSELPRASVNVVRCARALMDAIRGVA